MPRGRPTAGSLALVSNREEEPDASYKTDLWLVAADNADRGASLMRLTNDDRVKSSPAGARMGAALPFSRRKTAFMAARSSQ